jgi:hypothetical protein
MANVMALPSVFSRSELTGEAVDLGQTRGPSVELLRADRIAMEPVSWLWEGHLAAGKVHILAGAPGTGKTTLALSMGGTISRGGWARHQDVHGNVG